MKANSRLNKQACSLVFARQINAPTPRSLPSPLPVSSDGESSPLSPIAYQGPSASTALSSESQGRKESPESLLWAVLPGPQRLWTWGAWSPSQLSQAPWALQMSALRSIFEKQPLPGERARRNGFLPLGFLRVLFRLRQDLAV